jgi:hypothetical protein
MGFHYHPVYLQFTTMLKSNKWKQCLLVEGGPLNTSMLHLNSYKGFRVGNARPCSALQDGCCVTVPAQALGNKKTPWPESASELYLQSDRRFLTKLVPTFADTRRWWNVVSVTDPYGRILGFLDWIRYYFFQVAPQTVLTRLSWPRSRPTTSQKIW